VFTDGVVPSLHVEYKSTRVKQYHKEGIALRTETTINDARDFKIGKRLPNLPALREVGFNANRRLLDVQRISHDAAIGEIAFDQIARPVLVAGQRAPALRFGDPRVHALLAAIVVFRLLPDGFAARDLRTHLAPLLGLNPESLTPGRITYDLRRLRLRGLVERIPGTHRYRVTDLGLRTALFFTRAHNRLLRTGMAELNDPAASTSLSRAFARIETEMDRLAARSRLAA
jgi:hypothetical protein